MTKTLTEQWREGKLPEDTYYVRFICGRYGVYEFEQYKGFGFDNDLAYIKEVLAPVPSYDEYKRLQEQLNDANKTIKEAQELCPDKNVMLMCNPARPSFGMMTNDVLTKYLEKWGVK